MKNGWCWLKDAYGDEICIPFDKIVFIEKEMNEKYYKIILLDDFVKHFSHEEVKRLFNEIKGMMKGELK